MFWMPESAGADRSRPEHIAENIGETVAAPSGMLDGQCKDLVRNLGGVV